MTWRDWIGTVKQGDCLDLMEQMPEGVVHCVVTSPPYFGLRDYQTEGQMGLEKTPELYVSKMVEVFREVKRIMHPTGTLWLNMGDSYASNRGSGAKSIGEKQKTNVGANLGRLIVPDGYKEKDLMEIPSDLVRALRADGWWLRSRIPWLKRNAMPESVQGSRWERHRVKVKRGEERTQKYGGAGLGFRDHSGLEIKGAAEYVDCPGCPKCDPNDGLVLRMSAGRPTQAVEYVFLLQKSPECFYDGEAVRVKNLPQTIERYRHKESLGLPRVWTEDGGDGIPISGGKEVNFNLNPSGRSRRNSDWFFESWQGLWTDENGEPLAFIVNPKPYKRAHFATFPPGLVIPCLKAGTSERGACPECGNPWVRVIQTKNISRTIGDPKEFKSSPVPGDSREYSSKQAGVCITKTLGWRPTCSCSKEPVPCLVCDIFAGTGTVIEVARKMGRSGLGFEISEEYVKKYCGERLAQGVLGLKQGGVK